MKKVLIFLSIILPLFGFEFEKISFDEKLDVKIKNHFLSVGIGSGAFYLKNDLENIFYAITDKGFDIDCKKSKELLGKKICKKGKIFPLKDFEPTIYKIKLLKNSYQILKKIQIKDKNNILNSNIKNAYDLKGNKLSKYRLDPEALVVLSDDSFWISDEYENSLLHVSKDGVILKKVVPKGHKNSHNALPALPSILNKTNKNKSIEALAISPDEKYLYFMTQSPLANPDKKSTKYSANMRIFKYDIKQNKTIAQYAYQTDASNTFKLDKNKKQNHVKISEMASSNKDELIILERITKTTKLYKVNLKNATNILNSKYDDVATLPSFEQEYKKDFLPKKLIFNSSNLKNFPSKIEALAYINENNFILLNDNDFGKDNEKTYIIKVKN